MRLVGPVRRLVVSAARQSASSDETWHPARAVILGDRGVGALSAALNAVIDTRPTAVAGRVVLRALAIANQYTARLTPVKRPAAVGGDPQRPSTFAGNGRSR